MPSHTGKFLLPSHAVAIGAALTQEFGTSARLSHVEHRTENSDPYLPWTAGCDHYAVVVTYDWRDHHWVDVTFDPISYEAQVHYRDIA